MKAYPKYKDSGVEWLGEVPAGWEVSRFKNHLHERDERSESGDETLLSVSAYTGVRPRSEGIEDGEFLSRAESLQGYKVAYSGDLVMNIMLAWNRAQGITDFNGIVSPAYAVFKLNSSIFPAYLNHLVRTDEYCRYFKAFSAGVIDSRLRLYPEKFGGLFAIIPPLSEQRKIAAFLDRDVAKIDDLIEEQRRLIALLAEKRQATISHAVTKGLNPNVKFKPSGIDWLGDVPEGWDVVPLSTLANEMQTGPFGSQLHVSDYITDGIPLINPSHIIDGKISPSSDICVSPETAERLASHKLQAEDLILARRGELGRCAVVPIELGTMLCGTGSIRLRLNGSIVSPRFLAEYIRSVYVREWLNLQSVGSTMPNLNTTMIAGIRVPLPPLTEQLSLLSELDKTLNLIDDLANDAADGITLLQERRSALISAAVTGKIDLRAFDDSILE